MKQARKIYITGEINDELYERMAKELDELEATSILPITIELCSSGGYAYAAIAIYGRLRTSKSKIFVNAFGCVESAAVLILAAGDVRQMHLNSWAMVHEDLGTTEARTSGLVHEAKNMLMSEKTWCTIMASRTKLSYEAWRKLHRKETYMYADECLKAGLVDTIFGQD